jgi:hypothetical protein
MWINTCAMAPFRFDLSIYILGIVYISFNILYFYIHFYLDLYLFFSFFALLLLCICHRSSYTASFNLLLTSCMTVRDNTTIRSQAPHQPHTVLFVMNLSYNNRFFGKHLYLFCLISCLILLIVQITMKRRKLHFLHNPLDRTT